VRTLFAVLLLFEGLGSGLRAVTRLPVLFIYPWDTVLFMVLRLVIALQQFAAGWLVRTRRPLGPALARWAYPQSAVLVTLELGFGLAPTNIFPAYRWWVVGLYWLYAAAGMAVFRRRADE
jgi:hypothetical protein